ncbi:MAG: rhodanese-like domain-containing protein [Bradymonadia bacterium]
MSRFLAGLCAAAALTLVGTVATACPGGEMKAQATPATMTTAQLEEAMSAKKVTVVDTNNAEKFAKAHIPGATHVPYDQVSASTLPADKNASLVFYCANTMCGASKKAATAAMGEGYNNVAVYPEGIDGWVAAGKPVEAAKAAKAAKGGS